MYFQNVIDIHFSRYEDKLFYLTFLAYFESLKYLDMGMWAYI